MTLRAGVLHLLATSIVACGAPPSRSAPVSQEAPAPLSPLYVPARPAELGGDAGVVSNADVVVASLRPRFTSCYQAGLRDDPTMEGKIVVSAKVSTAGDVTSADVGSLTGLSNDVAACIAAVVKAATFAQRDGSESATLQIPVSFVQAKRRSP